MDPLQAFAELCRPTSAADLDRLRRRIDRHVDAIDVELAHKLADALITLADDAAALDADGRALLGGALEYFLLSSDADNDLRSPGGLRDDAEVVAHVCRVLGRPDLATGI